MRPNNKQPIEKPVLGSTEADFDKLEINSIWYTIQGEGPFAGTPAVFVRFAGCNLQCRHCDTEYTKRKVYTAEEALVAVRSLRSVGLVVLTGGEPFRQPINKFVHGLLEAGYDVQIETNGTLYRDLNWYNRNAARLTIVCSPKTPSINSMLVPHIDAWKYIVQANYVDNEDGLPTATMGMMIKPARPNWDDVPSVYVQPLDSHDEQLNFLHTKEAIRVAKKYGYRLCLQVQKIIGVD